LNIFGNSGSIFHDDESRLEMRFLDEKDAADDESSFEDCEIDSEDSEDDFEIDFDINSD
jgi:hypothetical protein